MFVLTYGTRLGDNITLVRYRPSAKQMRLSVRRYKMAMKRGQIRSESTQLVNVYPVSSPEVAKASRMEFTVSFEYDKAEQHET